MNAIAQNNFLEIAIVEDRFLIINLSDYVNSMGYAIA